MLYCLSCEYVSFELSNFTQNRAEYGGVFAIKAENSTSDVSTVYNTNITCDKNNGTLGGIIYCSTCTVYSNYTNYTNTECDKGCMLYSEGSRIKLYMELAILQNTIAN